MLQGTWRHVQKSIGIHLFTRYFQKELKRLSCQKTDKHTRWNRIFLPLNQEFICLVLMTWALDETTWHIVLGHLRVNSPDNAEWSHGCWEAGWFKLPCRQLPSKIWDLGIMMPMPGYMYLFLFHITWGSEEHIFSSYKQQESWKSTTRNTHMETFRQRTTSYLWPLVPSFGHRKLYCVSPLVDPKVRVGSDVPPQENTALMPCACCSEQLHVCWHKTANVPMQFWRSYFNLSARDTIHGGSWRGSVICLF